MPPDKLATFDFKIFQIFPLLTLTISNRIIEWYVIKQHALKQLPHYARKHHEIPSAIIR